MRFLLSIVALVVLSGTAAAQTVVNRPGGVSFSASVDHNTIWTPAPGEPGVPTAVLSNYLMEVQENDAAVRTTDIGKPTPSATGQIATPLVQTGLQENHTYRVVMIAVGPAGSNRALPSNPFGWFVALPAPAGVTNVTLLAQMPTPPPGITIGGRVMAGSLGVLVRPAPSLSAPSDIVQPPGALGTAIGGPTIADGYTWWNVDWDTGADGWCTEGASFLIVAPE